MRQILTIILIIIVLISTQVKKQEVKAENPIKRIEATIDTIDFEPYDYDTILSGGYNLKYKVYNDGTTDEKLQSLTLRKGFKEIKVLNETSFPMLFKNLGYIGADFDSSFVFVQSFGSGNPNYIQLIDKETGEILREGTWVDVDEKEQILLYIENEYQESEQLKLYDVRKRKEIIVPDFKDSKCVQQAIGGLRNCVEIGTVTANQIVLKIDTDEEKIKKKYNR